MEGPDGADHHGAEEVLVRCDELGVKGRRGALEQHVRSLVGGGIEGDAKLLYLLDCKLARGLDAAHDDLGVDPLLNEGLELLEDLPREEHHRCGPVPDLGVLAHANVNQSLGGWMLHVKELHNGGAVIADSHLPSVGDELVHPPWAEGRPDRVGHRLAGVDVADELRLALSHRWYLRGGGGGSGEWQKKERMGRAIADGEVLPPLGTGPNANAEGEKIGTGKTGTS